LKEKHFNMLGLRKMPKAASTEDGKHQSGTESESDDNEEFVPSKKVVSVGRPNVTLRSLRQQKHQLPPPVPTPPGVKIVQLADKEIPLRGRRPQKEKTAEKILPIVTSVHNFPSPSSSGITRMPNKNYSSPDRNIHPQSPPISTPSPTAATSTSSAQQQQRMDNFLCTCAEMSKYFVRRTDATSYCVAIDEIDGQKIGCSNEMVGELLNLRRPSVKASYMILCRSHEKRLLAHNCCAGCGVFLTKGIFMLCNNKHFFHRNCATKFIYNAPYDANSRDFLVPQLVLKCPHCGTDAPVNEISITFKCSGKAPVFSPSRDVM
jgi:[histone H3]-lysine9 N-trimethyltransferase EHMT